VRPFTKSEYDEAGKLMHEEVLDKDNSKLLDTMSKTKDLVRKVILGWRNFVDLGTLEEIEFKSDSTSGIDKSLWDSSRMPDWVYSDLRAFVYRLSGVTAGERISLK
jgi:hypothetical protein